jgi:preprotein translocase subunit SecY
LRGGRVLRRDQSGAALLAEQAQNTMFGLYDMFSGGNLSRVTIFALGVMPYISSSIILQLLTVVSLPRKISKEGELAGARSRSTPATARSC